MKNQLNKSIKSTIKLSVLSVLLTTIVGCSSDGGDSSNNYQPNPIGSIERTITQQELSLNSQEFITENFSNLIVTSVVVTEDKFSKNYEVRFNNDFKIEFDANGNWKKVEGKRQAIPTKFIDQKILDYVNNKYTNVSITEIEKKKSGIIEIELSNGLELKFDSNGNFAGIDSDSDERIITLNNLPKNAQTFIEEYFVNLMVSYVKVEDKLYSKEYEVKFTNGIEIEFDQNGIWQEIDGNKQAIPTKFINQNILNYLDKYFKNIPIIKIEKKNFGRQEIKLSNRTELIFDSQGDFEKFD